MASRSVPFYKKKYDNGKYRSNGDPEALTFDDLKKLTNWTPIKEEKKEIWEDAKSIVDQKDKKREFLVNYWKEPKFVNGKYQMFIEMLHADHRGFTYFAEEPDVNTLNREFWPVVEYLIAIYFSPKIRLPSKPPLSGTDTTEDAVYQDRLRLNNYNT